MVERLVEPLPENPQNMELPSMLPEFTQPIDKTSVATKEKLGGKGFSLCEMAKLGLLVPPGFIITTDAWREFQAAGNTLPVPVIKEVKTQLGILEKETDCRLGDPQSPLFVSVRSGAPVSMPGVMTTILNVGINDETVKVLGKDIGAHAAWEAYYELVSSFGSDVFGIDSERFKSLWHKQPDTALGLNELALNKSQEAVEKAKQIIEEEDYYFPQNPQEQVLMAIEAVFKSWSHPRAQKYRRLQGINEQIGTAAIVQKMVWGNAQKEGSGSGVMLTRNIQTFAPEPIVVFIERTQGVKVVGEDGLHEQRSIEELPVPDNVKEQLYQIAQQLEEHFYRPQDFEFTYDGKHLWALQTRDVPLQSTALFRLLQHNLEEGRMSEAEAQRLINPIELESLLIPPLDPVVVRQKRETGNLVATGTSISLGNSSGMVVTSIEEVVSNPQREVVLAIENLSLPIIIELMDEQKYPNIVGLIAGNGGIGSHIARVGTRVGERMPIIFGATNLTSLSKGGLVTVDGDTGEVFPGRIPRTKKNGVKILTQKELGIVEKWHKERLQNHWRFVTTEEGIDQYVKVGQEAYQRAREEFQSPRAHVQAVINALVPEDILIKYTIAKPSETERIKALMRDILNDDKHVTARTCFKPDRPGGPWVFITDSSQIEDFFDNSSYPGKYGGYPRWITDSELTEVLVGRNPKDKLNEDENIRREHGAWILTCTGLGKVVLQIQPHTPHLRGQEEVKKNDIVTCFVHLDPNRPEVIKNIQVETGEGLINDPIATNITEHTIDTVLKSWWNQYDIPKRIAAATEIFPPPVFPIPVLEGQTRAFSQWCLVYGMKIDKIERE